MCEFDDNDYIYQSFWFKNEIKEHFYAGNGFITHKKDMDIEESFDLALEMAGDKEAFMPGLVKKIESLIGQENCRYDFWEFSDEDFSLYWLIKKDVYLEKMKLIKEWIKFEELEELIGFEVKENFDI
ncbi:MAG: hypothetical protein H8D45_15620 [Bacteroidetes bacterium]|nr:hypothetical protein [Bacteroidota bacterium]MBL7103550.1 hypothetical protein [Bacteroidales bacterium]